MTDERPDERDEGFWPSLDPEAPGYIGDPLPTDVNGSQHAAEYEQQTHFATARMAAFEAGDWEYIGLRCRAIIHIPIGGNSFRVLTIESAGLWGVESDAPDDYVRKVFGDERETLLSELRTLGRALGSEPDFDEEGPEL
ncbi:MULTISPECIES: hypothetical protein [unclassified Sphingopyxis]|uniref:hypothetical protein n=1 Tax=unclassified Sphingopyxis TaxID=2614943 RepID=UPI00285CADBD|nr:MULTISPECIES: hypothetical protein [unclassified Sphingopyxis]MDR7061194.1 hypothetical protein [Sphingopyxis sp. BE235]MDR7182075.1 hypothetical protein [Sphingopyxis sp. BE249]